MGHPNLSEGINQLINNQLMYRDMTMGEIITIHWSDLKGSERTIRLKVASLGTDKQGDPVPAFLVLDDVDVYSWQGEPLHLNAGSFAMPGVSATILPNFIMRMVGFGGIGIGRDYCLERVGQELAQKAVITNVREISRQKAVKGNENGNGIWEYLDRVEQAEAREAEAEAKRKQRLLGRLKVTTLNSVYEIEAADSSGHRSALRNGKEVWEGTLYDVKVASSLIFYQDDQTGYWETTRVTSIEYLDEG